MMICRNFNVSLLCGFIVSAIAIGVFTTVRVATQRLAIRMTTWG
jgi:hypothetical protein